eukprot:5978802-Prymnesium_polylepis.2
MSNTHREHRVTGAARVCALGPPRRSSRRRGAGARPRDGAGHRRGRPLDGRRSARGFSSYAVEIL